MDEKKKRKYDTVPEIYMNGIGNEAFFRPHYPVESSECTEPAVPDEEPAGTDEFGFLYDGDMRNEHRL